MSLQTHSSIHLSTTWNCKLCSGDCQHTSRLSWWGKLCHKDRERPLRPWVHHEERIPEPLSFFFFSPLWSPPFLSVKCPPHQFGYTNQHRAPSWAMCHFFRLGKEQPVPQSQAGNVPSSSGRRPWWLPQRNKLHLSNPESHLWREDVFLFSIISAYFILLVIHGSRRI